MHWRTSSRAETITITDAGSGQVYDTESFSGFHQGEYAIWNMKGNFVIQVTPTAGSGAAVSGIFLN